MLSFKNILALTAMLTLLAAQDGYVEKKQLKVKGDFVRSDELGNAFLVNDNKLAKYSQDGTLLHTYSNLYAGDITFIDTQDPFKILLYYRDFGKVDFLDQSLSLASSTIDLSMLGLSLASLACASYAGAFWVYNPMNFEMVRVNAALEVSDRSGNLQQATGHTPDPNYMLERDNFVYLNDPAIGIMMFDKYGTFYKTIPVKGLSSFQVFDNKLIYVTGNDINIYDIRLNEVKTTALPVDGAVSVSVCLSLDPQMLYVLEKDKLVFYTIK